MDLWIRTQNKTMFLKVMCIMVIDQMKPLTSDGFYVSSIEDNTEYPLGKYATKERALEVIDEIQNLLSPRYIVKNPPIDDEILKSFSENGIISPIKDADVQICQANSIVYQMPEE